MRELYTRQGKRLSRPKVGAPKRQLVGIDLKDHSDEDVHGNEMSPARRTDRIATLAQCLELYQKLSKASDGKKEEVITQAIELLEQLGVWSENKDQKEEAFLCVMHSGILLLCVDVALKALEDWDYSTSMGILRSAERLWTRECYEGALGVTKENRVRCDQFVGRYMPGYDFPGDLDSDMAKVMGRWDLYLKSEQKPTEYFECFIVKSISEDVHSRILEVRKYSTKMGYTVLEKLSDAMEDLRVEFEAEDESSSDSS